MVLESSLSSIFWFFLAVDLSVSELPDLHTKFQMQCASVDVELGSRHYRDSNDGSHTFNQKKGKIYNKI